MTVKNVGKIVQPFAAELTLCWVKLQAVRRQATLEKRRKERGRIVAPGGEHLPPQISGGQSGAGAGGGGKGIISGDFNEVTRATNDTIYRITG